MNAPLAMTREAERRRKRLVNFCSAFPGVDIAGDPHIAFKVRKKTFAWYLFDHHGDGMIALCCKAPPGEQRSLVRANPERFFVPPYVGSKGWVALRLDLPVIDWSEVVELATHAYRLTAPAGLAARIDPETRE